ncbi:heavy metal tolerance protein [Diplogelasinospora grovesii]|uniref:Heavy metal tolerance protein n=1 Tax=Diplogelasinospora grovesii TaxID=303347 RepID=A0AAN6S4Y5_9PEZI|nr:heavy metal tolerance protein [Diplogelasinospora grovesii]
MNPYYATFLLASLPTLYVAVHSKKLLGPAIAEWSKNYDDLKIFLPLLLPEVRAIQREVIWNLSIVAMCTGTNRIIKVISPILLRRVIDMLQNSTDTQKLPWKEVLAFVLLRNVVERLSEGFMFTYKGRAIADMADQITLAVYNKLLNQSAEYHENKSSGSMWKAVCESGTSTLHYFSNLVFHQIPVIFDILLGVGTCWSIFDRSLAAAMFAVIALYVGVSIALPGWNRQGYEQMIKLSLKASDIGHDTILNWHTVSYFNRAAYERERYTAALLDTQMHYFTFRRPLSWTAMTKNLATCVGVGAVCLLGCYEIQHSKRGAGDFVMLFQFWTDLFVPLDSLVDIFVSCDRFISDSHKFIEILKLNPAVQDRKDAKDFDLENGTIEFANVSFSYDGKRDAIQDVSFKAEGGKMLAIVGETGGGKSTLFKLLCRAYDVTKGSIKIDGQDVRDVRLASLREHISIVPQNIGVFNTTVLENLRYANLEATREQIEQACKAAALHKRIVAFPNGYDEVVGEKGSKLSGGELQRLAIARALLRKAQIVLFDEATSNLDAETEASIQDYLRNWYNGRTVVVVAHRLATIATADMILAVKDGQIVEAGRHEDLLAKQGYFYQLWNKQRLQWDPTKKEPKQDVMEAVVNGSACVGEMGRKAVTVQA